MGTAQLSYLTWCWCALIFPGVRKLLFRAFLVLLSSLPPTCKHGPSLVKDWRTQQKWRNQRAPCCKLRLKFQPRRALCTLIYYSADSCLHGLDRGLLPRECEGIHSDQQAFCTSPSIITKKAPSWQSDINGSCKSRKDQWMWYYLMV